MLLFGEVNADPLTYKVVGDTVTIKDCKETASGALAIPLPMTENRSPELGKMPSMAAVV